MFGQLFTKFGIGAPNSVTGTFDILTQKLNKGKESGASDKLVGLWEGGMSSAYMLHIAPWWDYEDGALEKHIAKSLKTYGFSVINDKNQHSLNIALVMQGECTMSDLIPLHVSIEG